MCCGKKRKSLETPAERTLASPLGAARPSSSQAPPPPARGDGRRDAAVTVVK